MNPDQALLEQKVDEALHKAEQKVNAMLNDAEAKDHESVMKMIEHNEEKFEVMRKYVFGTWTLLWVVFPDCPNGSKIMLFRTSVLQQQEVVPYTHNECRVYAERRGYKKIMPHFNTKHSPFARFEPTEYGWAAAIKLMDQIE